MGKTLEEKIAVMQAFADGKEIECIDKYDDNDEWAETPNPSWNWKGGDYRIKAEPKYSPYKDTEEMINDFCKRFGVKRTNYGEPFIWVKYGSLKKLITVFDEYIVYIEGLHFTLDELFKNFTYLDGSKCGVAE